MLHLGLDEFLASEPVHFITPIGATFLRQRATQMRASSKCPRVDSSSSGAPHPPLSTSGNPTADPYVDPTAATVPPPSTSNDSDIRLMLKIVMIVQEAHG